MVDLAETMQDGCALLDGPTELRSRQHPQGRNEVGTGLILGLEERPVLAIGEFLLNDPVADLCAGRKHCGSLTCPPQAVTRSFFHREGVLFE